VASILFSHLNWLKILFKRSINLSIIFINLTTMKYTFLFFLFFVTAFLKAQDVTPPVAICKDFTTAIGEFGFTEVLNPADIDSGSYDEESGIAFMELNVLDYSCEAIWEINIATLTVTDNEGNTASCDATITVIDLLPPVEVFCLDINVALNEEGYAFVESWELEAGSSDNCGINHSVSSQTAFYCEHQGDNVVEVTFYDYSGNAASCQSIVTITDPRPPVAVCLYGSLNVFLQDGTGSMSLQDINENYASCNILSSTLSRTEFTCADIGLVEVILSVVDVNDNETSCTTDVYVVDGNSFVQAVCRDITVQLVEGVASITFEDVDGGSTSSCGFDASLSVSAFGIADTGNNVVTVTLTDASLNESSCQAIVTVENSVTAPQAVCQDITVQLDADGLVTISPEELDGGSSDANGIASFEASQVAFDCSNKGENIVTLTVINVYNLSASCDAVMTIVDETAPVAVCRDITVTLMNGFAEITPLDINDNSSDNCSIGSLEVSASFFTCDNIGINPVTLTVSDLNGLTDECIANVNVAGSIPDVAIEQGEMPVFCQGDQVVLSAVSSEEVTYQWSIVEEGSRSIISNGDLPRLAFVFETGNYRVVVTNANGCTAEDTIKVDYDKTRLASTYTIIAKREAAFKRNTVGSGAVGILTAAGKAKLESSTMVTDAGTYIKAPLIEVKTGSVVSEKITGVAMVTLPEFFTNPYGASTNNITVPDNATVTLSGDIYGTVTIGRNAKVTFANPELYMKSYTAKDGSIVRFASCTKMMVSRTITIGKKTQTNPGNQKLIIYNDYNASAPEFLISEESLFNGNVYLLNGDLKTNTARVDKPIQMNGQFIVDKLLGLDNAIWNQNPACDPDCIAPVARLGAPSAWLPEEVGTEYKNIITEIVLDAVPNPFNQATSIQFMVPETGRVKLDVLSLTGQLIGRLFEGEAEAGKSYQVKFDAAFATPGIYFYKLESESGESRVKKMVITK